MEYLLAITPQPALRPRSEGNRAKPRTPEKYRNYQKRLVAAILATGIPDKQYVAIRAVFYMPIPKTRKRKISPGYLHQIKPDSDNLLKALKDCLEKSGVVANDKQFAIDLAMKYWCGTPKGYIYFTLYTKEEALAYFEQPVTITEEFDSL